jgi:hypothetical protein
MTGFLFFCTLFASVQSIVRDKNPHKVCTYQMQYFAQLAFKPVITDYIRITGLYKTRRYVIIMSEYI